MLRNLPKVTELLSGTVSAQNSLANAKLGALSLATQCGPQDSCTVITWEYHSESQVQPQTH